MTDQALDAVESDPLERMMDILDEEDANPPDEESENEEAETEEKEESEESEESEEKAPEAEELEVIVHNGEEKQLTKAEMREYAQQGFDATQKWQAAAERQRYLDAREVAIQEQAQFAAQFTDQIAQAKALESQLAQWKSVNWTELAQTDPMQYLSLHHQYTEAKDAYQNQIQTLNHLQTQAKQTAEQQQAQRKATEAQALKQAIPDWKDATRAQTEWAELDAWLTKAGYEPNALNSVMDHRQIVVARKAMLYDKLMAQGKQQVKTAAPPVAKPGSAAKPTNTDGKKIREALKKTGKDSYAAKAIEQML